ncbi:MAG TPA: ABC transporter ATP-binding protein [Desulfobulbaceae bacterium]|nr:ABC transporter ATP-binding protein [Desulfobulbaceae bacterium]
MSSAAPLISVRNVGVRYRVNRNPFRKRYYDALKNISFDLYPGDSLGIVGRNGAGKTTMLRLLSGIIAPDSGYIDFADITTSLLSLQVGFDPELSGRDNAILSGMLLGFPMKTIESNLDTIFAFSELTDFIDKPVKFYSAGMRARLGFSITLGLSPDVLLIDEVLGVGDIDFRKKSMEVMKEKLLSDQTIVLVSHSAATVKELCNRAVWIKNGVSKMEGDAVTVVNAYEQDLLRHAKK